MEHFDLRKREIIKACQQLYDKYSFKEIMVNLINEHTSFSNPSIYNHFETKEEIFLALFGEEYDKWTKELTKIIKQNNTLTKDEFAKLLR